MFALKGFDNCNPHFLLEAAGKSFGILFVQSLPLETRINSMLDRLSKPLAFRNRHSDVSLLCLSGVELRLPPLLPPSECEETKGGSSE